MIMSTSRKTVTVDLATRALALAPNTDDPQRWEAGAVAWYALDRAASDLEIIITDAMDFDRRDVSAIVNDLYHLQRRMRATCELARAIDVVLTDGSEPPVSAEQPIYHLDAAAEE
jgi:hypothetical protein